MLHPGWQHLTVYLYLDPYQCQGQVPVGLCNAGSLAMQGRSIGGQSSLARRQPVCCPADPGTPAGESRCPLGSACSWQHTPGMLQLQSELSTISCQFKALTFAGRHRPDCLSVADACLSLIIPGSLPRCIDKPCAGPCTCLGLDGLPVGALGLVYHMQFLCLEAWSLPVPCQHSRLLARTACFCQQATNMLRAIVPDDHKHLRTLRFCT